MSSHATQRNRWPGTQRPKSGLRLVVPRGVAPSSSAVVLSRQEVPFGSAAGDVRAEHAIGARSCRVADGMDALCLGSWNQSACVCGLRHWKTAFLFQPLGSEKVLACRAGVRACFVDPKDRKASYWKLLWGRSIAQLSLTKPFDCVRTSVPSHTVFLIDFRAADGTLPMCGQDLQDEDVGRGG